MQFQFGTKYAHIVVTIPDEVLPQSDDLVSRGTEQILNKLVPDLFRHVTRVISQIVVLASHPKFAIISPILARRSIEGLDDAFDTVRNYQDQIMLGSFTAKEIADAERQRELAEERDEPTSLIEDWFDRNIDTDDM